MSDSARLFLAVDLDGDGAHPAAWRHSGHPPGAVLTPGALRATVTAAETTGFTLATFADAPVPPSDGPGAAGRLEAGTRAAFVSTLTDRIGLAPTLHVTTTEPFHLATQLASLDHASRGRAGWVVGAAADALATVGASAPEAGALRREVLDVIDTARALWDSWEDDAVIKDVETGHYLDADKVHHIDFTGATFTVKGPLITPRPPQGQVVVIAPAALGVDDHADVILVDGTDPGDREALTFAEVEVVLVATQNATYNFPADLARGWRASTCSPADGPAGTSSPPTTRGRGRTSATAAGWSTSAAMSGPASSWRPPRSCGPRGSRTRSPSRGTPRAGRGPARSAMSGGTPIWWTSAPPRQCRAARRGGRSCSRPGTPKAAGSWPPLTPTWRSR